MKKIRQSYSAPVSPGENAQFQVNITDADTGSKIATTKIERRTARCRRRRSIFTLTCLFCSLYFHFFSLSLLICFFSYFFLFTREGEWTAQQHQQWTDNGRGNFLRQHYLSISVSPSLSCVVFNLHNRYTIHIGCCCLFKAKQKETFAKVQSERPFSPPTRPPLYTNNSVDKSFQFSWMTLINFSFLNQSPSTNARQKEKL